ncbi:DNA starvation/stationary phase protection protein [Salinibacter sp. 10B]|uniref:Dps family protein n=1 Tax=Salinibacter sp. 10B TaxID=1923971 RepID=UPI0021585091|nr:DNA starvation/stationary phase protection protein [Salinibacter sp. 10B]
MPTTQTKDAAQTTEQKTGHGDPWRPQQMIEENPVGLSEEATEELIPKLDEIQCTLWTLYHQYHKHHWLVEGPQFRDLHHFLEENYEEVHKYVDRIAERITALGGIPTSSPANQAELSHVEHEPEGTYRLRAMLEHDLEGERILSVLVRETIDVALEHGDHGTKRELEKVLTKAEDRAHHLDHFLGEDTLEYGLSADEPAQG